MANLATLTFLFLSRMPVCSARPSAGSLPAGNDEGWGVALQLSNLHTTVKEDCFRQVGQEWNPKYKSHYRRTKSIFF